MKEPIYILKISEKQRVSKSKTADRLKKIVVCICGVLLLFSFLLGENLFGELSFMAKILLIGLVFGIVASTKKEFLSYPLEIHFFEDMLEVHRMEVHYSDGKVKRELHRFEYANSPKFIYDHRNRYVTIKGIAHGEWYIYSKDGTLNSAPERVSDTNGICYFYIADEIDLDIVSEVRGHSPISVETINK